jgi:diadenosine tetraphosphate (Ap4A) HIT family hydrolase
MLMVVSRRHMTQDELWGSGDLMSKIAELAVQMGHDYAPDGFRILSNFGNDALQTQPHGHLHVIGGQFLGRYVG